MMQAVAIETARDTEAVELALFEMMEQALGKQCQDALRRRLRDASPEDLEKALGSYEVKRTLADGFYNWGYHLMTVEAAVTAGITLRADHLTRDEAAGMLALRRARNKFNEAHPGCRHCGHPRMDRQGTCAICGKGDDA